jgi:hypothetical protein
LLKDKSLSDSLGIYLNPNTEIVHPDFAVYIINLMIKNRFHFQKASCDYPLAFTKEFGNILFAHFGESKGPIQRKR